MLDRIVMYLVQARCYLESSLAISMGIYVDEFNTSADVVLGGNLWLYMDWLRLGFSALICILSGINLFAEKK